MVGEINTCSERITLKYPPKYDHNVLINETGTGQDQRLAIVEQLASIVPHADLLWRSG